VTAPDSEARTEGFGHKVRSGMRWSLFNSAAARLLNVAAGLIIARVVTPGEFGTFAAGSLVMVALLSMNELGVSVAVIRWPKDVHRVTPTAVTCALGGSVAWFAVMFAGAPLIASLLNAPDATIVIQILSFALVLDGLSTIPNALLMRGFRQRLRTVADLVGFLVGSPIGIVLAASGWGAAGLATGLLVSNAVTTAIIWWLAPQRPRPGWNAADARNLVRWGLPAAATSLVLLAIVNVDYVVVSRVLGVTALGFYVLAFNVASWPWTLLSMSIRQVSLPAFSRLADDRDELERAFARSLTLAAGVAVLGGLLLTSLAEPVVRILYGETWLPAVVALHWLAVLGAIRVVLDLCYDLLIAVGRAGALVRVQLLWLAALIVGLPVGAHINGIAGVAVAHALVAALIILPLHVLLLRGAGMRLGALARAMAPVGAAAGAGGALALAAMQVDASPLSTLLGVGFVVAGAYIGVFALVEGGRAAVAWATARRSTEEARPVAA
jgi:O-antigen/teichoic acid export membrane protein